jgi:hypothetical protein
LTERALIGVTGPADRLLVRGLADLQPLFEELHGNVLLVGGLMARVWLHLRPVEGLLPRATADIDLGIDRGGLGLTARSERIKPMLEAKDYRPLPGDEGFRFRKELEGAPLLVDVFVAKGASREEPPILEKGVRTLAAPGLAYGLSRGPRAVEVEFADGGDATELRLPLPTLDAAFVMKGALTSSGVRLRADRRQRDRVDTVMLAAACLQDADALQALRAAKGKEPRAALRWMRESLDDAGTPAAQALERHLLDEHALPGGGEWAVGVAERLARALAA